MVRTAALLAALVLSGCAGPRQTVATAPVVATPPPPVPARAPVAAQWRGPLDVEGAARLFADACLAFAPGFESARALDAAGFRERPQQPAGPGAIFYAARPDGAAAGLARRFNGTDAPERRCWIETPAGPDFAPQAMRRALAPRIAPALPGAAVRRSGSGWRAVDQETELDLRIRVARLGERVALSAIVVE